MTGKEAGIILVDENNVYGTEELREAFKLAKKALDILDTIESGKFVITDLNNLYKRGWNDALDAVKIEFLEEEQ